VQLFALPRAFGHWIMPKKEKKGATQNGVTLEQLRMAMGNTCVEEILFNDEHSNNHSKF
jgi:hypothetical protein